MGVLGVSGSTGEQHIDPPESEGQDGAPEVDGQARGDDGQFVPAAKLQPETQASRRERQWQERVSTYVKPIEEKWTAERQAYETRLAEADRTRQEHAQELARMRGVLETLQRQPMQQQPQQPAGPDPQELRRKAREALAANNLDEYERLRDEAADIVADRKAEAKVKQFQEQFQRSQPVQIPPHIQSLLYQSPAVAAAGDKGIRAVIRMEQELEDDGVPAGPQRTQKAFQTVNERLSKAAAPPARPQYSQAGAAALSGIPTQRGGSAGSSKAEDGVRLNEAQELAYKAGGFKSREEYLKWGDPRKFGLAK